MNADELIALAERVEALTGPCRDIEDEAAWAAGWRLAHGYWFPPESVTEARRRKVSILETGRGKGIRELPRFTASLDAAMTLRLPDYRMTLYTGDGTQKPVATAMSPQGEWRGQGVANTLPNAIVSAWLRARASHP